MVEIELIVCTRDRADLLGELFQSLARSRFIDIDPTRLSVLVVVNGPDRRGYESEQLADACPWPLRVVHEPRAGVRPARNTGFRNRSVDADWIVCVDDDHLVTPTWLEALISQASRTDAAAVTGPVLTIMPAGGRPWTRASYRNVPRYPGGTTVTWFQGGNVGFRNQVLDEFDGDWYDERHPLATGDDAHFAARLRAAGHRIEWNDTAIVWGWVHPDRLAGRWVIKRWLSHASQEAVRAMEFESRAAIARRLLRHVGMAVGAIPLVLRAPRDPQNQAEAIARACWPAGFIAGLAGHQSRDYAIMTKPARPPSAEAPCDPHRVQIRHDNVQRS